MFLFDWFRPKPEFAKEQVVRVDDDFSQERFMVIRQRRWARPNHAGEKQWVYDGPIFAIVDHKPVLITYGYYFREEALAPILGLGSLIELV